MISAGRGVRRILEGPAETGLDLAQGDRRMGGGVRYRRREEGEETRLSCLSPVHASICRYPQN